MTPAQRIRLDELKALKRWSPSGWWSQPGLEQELLQLEITAGVPWGETL